MRGHSRSLGVVCLVPSVSMHSHVFPELPEARGGQLSL